ncbi:MAG TPA: DUF2752 domain-containing protein [Acidobacteriaceae bacterium]|nr:DUF2752 domain-containing protein [Acidobacteriaceae bacterium]
MNACASLRRRRIAANTTLAAALVLCAALVLFPPSRFTIYPQCPVHQYLGILCPGCGATRALAALLRGRIAEALRFNWLFVVLVPAAVAGGLRTYTRAIHPGEFRWPCVPAPALAAVLIAATIFTIARNLGRLSL